MPIRNGAYFGSSMIRGEYVRAGAQRVVECSKARGFSSALRELPQCEKEKDALKTSVAPAVAVLSSSLASRFGIEAGAATAMAAVALLLSLKMSVNAWCSAVKAKVPEAAESKVLDEIAAGKTTEKNSR